MAQELELRFPEQSVQEAREVVAKLKRRTSSKLELAANIYDGHFLHIGYGYDEIIKQGTPGRYLHEMTKNTDCFTMAGSVIYLVAREAGLNPQLWCAVGMKDIREGQEASDKAPLIHSFVTCVVGKHAGKDVLQMVDPFMMQFGLATFDLKNHVIKIYYKRNREITYRHYGMLEQMSEQEYLTRLEQSRGTGGGRITLATTKAVTASGDKRVHITFLPKTQELKSSVAIPAAPIEPRNPNKNLVFDLITPVSAEGQFDLNLGRLEMYFALAAGWETHESAQIPLIFPASDALNLWEIYGLTANAMGRKSPITRMNLSRLNDLIRRAGFYDTFKLRPNSRAEQVIRRNNLEEEFAQVQTAQEKSVKDFVDRCKEDETTYISLLRAAHHTRANDQNRSQNNPYGLIFSNKEHVELLRQEFKKYRGLTADNFRRCIEEMAVKAGLKKGSSYHADRVCRIGFEKDIKQAEPFFILGGLHARLPLAFHLLADDELFKMKNGLYDADIPQLEQSITTNDLKRAAQSRLFNWLIFAGAKKDSLWLASFKKGLTRLLDTT